MAEGKIVIERDPIQFQTVLTYLSNGLQDLDTYFKAERQKLEIELEYFCIEPRRFISETEKRLVKIFKS